MNYFDRGESPRPGSSLEQARDEIQKLKGRRDEYADLDYADLRGGPADQHCF